MRRLLIACSALAAVAVSAAPGALGGTTNPCVLVGVSDASTVLGAKPAQGKVKTVGLYKSCTYTVKRKTMTVQTRTIAKESDFVKSAKATGLVIPISGIGDDAYSAGGGKSLLVWKNGIEITFTFIGVNPFVATQQSLAKSALGRL